jgi:hypothetical protein
MPINQRACYEEQDEFLSHIVKNHKRGSMIMKRHSSTCRGLKTAASASGLLVAGLISAGVARAGCTDARVPLRPATYAPTVESAHLSDAVYRLGDYDAARLIPVWYDQDERAAIVGFWTFEWRARADAALPNDNPGIPDGALLDFGLVQWHEDGTEITNSGGRTPAVGDVCMGAWKQVDRSTFILRHLALGYGPPPGPVMGYQGVAVLEMRVKVDSGGHTYHGNFTLTQYMSKFDPTVPGSEFDESTVEFTLSGTVKATRVAAD